MYGFSAKSSISRLNILQLLIRFLSLRAHIKKVHEKSLAAFDQKLTSTPKRRRHVTTDDNDCQLKKRRLNDFLGKSQPTLTKHAFHKAVVEFIVKRKEPLTIVEDEAFKDLMLKCHGNPDLNLPCYRTVVKLVDEQYQDSIQRLLKMIEDVDYVTMSTDGWSAVRKTFLGYTISWINKDYRRVGFALCCRRFKGSKTFDRVAHHIFNVMIEFLITSKCVGITTDGGSEYGKAFRLFGPEDEENSEQVEEDDEEEDIEHLDIGAILRDQNHPSIELPKHFDCFCHRLNLVGKACTKEAMRNVVFWTFFSKLRRIVKAQNYSSQKAQIIRDECVFLFKLPIVTRWNSEYTCIQDCLKKMEKSGNNLATLMAKLKIPLFTPQEVVLAKEYVTIMKPIVEALNIFQAEVVIGIGLCLPTISGVKKSLARLATPRPEGTNIVKMKNVLAFVQSEVQRRFNHFFDAEDYILAAISVPRFKTKWISNNADKEHAVNLLKNEVHKLTVNTSEELIRNQDQPMSTSPNLLDFSSEANDLSEVDEYLASKIDSFDSFKRGEFKNISKVFLKTNTPEPANTRSERLFSRGKLMFNTLRTNLSDDNFDKLLLLNCNKDL